MYLLQMKYTRKIISLGNKFETKLVKLAVPLEDFYHQKTVDNQSVLIKADKDDPQYQEIFNLFNFFDIPIVIFNLKDNASTEKFKEEIQAKKNPNAVNLVLDVDQFEDFSAGWIAHDVLHLIDSLSFRNLAYMLPYKKAFQRDFDQNIFADNPDFYEGLAVYFNSDPNIAQYASSSLINPNLIDVFPDIMVKYLLDNGERLPQRLEYKPLYERGGSLITQYQHLKGDKSKDVLVYPKDMSLPNLNECHKQVMDNIYSNMNKILSSNIGNVLGLDNIYFSNVTPSSLLYSD